MLMQPSLIHPLLSISALDRVRSRRNRAKDTIPIYSYLAPAHFSFYCVRNVYYFHVYEPKNRNQHHRNRKAAVGDFESNDTYTIALGERSNVSGLLSLIVGTQSTKIDNRIGRFDFNR